MTVEQLRAGQKASPFRPYTLELADGGRVHVRHPESVLTNPGGRTVVIATSDDAVNIIDLLLVAAIDISNGTPKRGRKRS